MAPEFCRLFYPAESSDELKIPNRFVSELENPLSRVCRIENEFGSVASVYFETGGDGHHFKYGWFHCARDNALRQGDFLMFNYEGNGLFAMRRYWARTRFPPFDLAEALDYYPSEEEPDHNPPSKESPSEGPSAST
ncbi:putative B3 domain-containing protein [Salvia divinorum]|uniref:B3 domain-containing protein n=1 Tax=Salvia divinorum TaxID=28513 RepID=A0ABD1I8N5_SALDI